MSVCVRTCVRMCVCLEKERETNRERDNCGTLTARMRILTEVRICTVR